MTKGDKKMAAVFEEPLFRSTVGALRFALNYSHGQTKKPFLARMMGGGTVGRGLGGLDGAGQAGMILVELQRISSELYQAILIGKYAVPSMPCACRSVCCRGWRESKDWAAAINWLTDHVLQEGLTGMISHHRFRRSMVSRYFGVKESFIQMSAACGVERHTAGQQYKKISEYLRDNERFARYEMEGLLKGAVVE